MKVREAGILYVIIPCYNEEKRIRPEVFEQTRSCKFVFVDDGSSDGTYSILERLSSCEHIDSFRINKNVGKANAVREGYQFLSSSLESEDHVGYLDADLSTTLEDFFELETFLGEHDLIMGSRDRRGNSRVVRRKERHFAGRIVAFILGALFKLPFYDTQCGAKVMGFSSAQQVFLRPFVTRWFVDVEIILRLGAERTREVPLKGWKHVGGSSIGFGSVPSIAKDIARLAWAYRGKRF